MSKSTEFYKNQQNLDLICLQAEVKRREVEVRKLNTELSETRRKNKQIQDKVAEQIEILQRKLQEYKAEHKQHEDAIEGDLAAKEEAIFNVKESLDKRKKALEIDYCDDEVETDSNTDSLLEKKLEEG